jgi:hypothetical protein
LARLTCGVGAAAPQWMQNALPAGRGFPQLAQAWSPDMRNHHRPDAHVVPHRHVPASRAPPAL